MKTHLYKTVHDMYGRLEDEGLNPEVDFITPNRLSAEIQKLQRAAEGDLQAAASVMSYLTSSIRDLRTIMQTALHEPAASRFGAASLPGWLWGRGGLDTAETSPARLLSWQEPVPGAATHAIIEAFTTDHIEAEWALKQRILQQALASSGRIQQAAACLLDCAAIQVPYRFWSRLSWMPLMSRSDGVARLETGRSWQLRRLQL